MKWGLSCLTVVKMSSSPYIAMMSSNTQLTANTPRSLPVLLYMTHKYTDFILTKILEVNLFAFACRLFHEDFSPIDGTAECYMNCMTLYSYGSHTIYNIFLLKPCSKHLHKCTARSEFYHILYQQAVASGSNQKNIFWRKTHSPTNDHMTLSSPHRPPYCHNVLFSCTVNW